MNGLLQFKNKTSMSPVRLKLGVSQKCYQFFVKTELENSADLRI